MPQTPGLSGDYVTFKSMNNAKFLTYLLLILATISVARREYRPRPLAAATPVFFNAAPFTQPATALSVASQHSVGQSLTYTVTATAYQAVSD